MKERIDVTVPEKELDRNDEKRERLKRTFRFEPTDRVPVVFEVQQALSLAARGSSFSAYIRSPRDNLREQILNFKWRCENIPDDRPRETELLLIEPDFGAQRGVEFPVQIVWTENEAPKVQPLLHHPEDIDKLAVPAAFALCGSNLFLWLLTDPDRIHRLMDIVTRSHLQCIEFFDDMLGRTGRRHLPEVGGDTGELVSPEHFREFFAPYVKRIWDRYDQWKTYHMCGKIDHILDILLCDLEVEFLNGFGFPVDRKTLGEKWAGKVVMRGGLHPDTLLASTPGAIAAEVLGYINTVGGQGGYILSDGYGLAPGTRVENLMAVLEASRRAGCPLRASTSPSPNNTERYPFIPTV